MSKYYFLKVKEVKKDTEDAVTITFWHPLNEVIMYKPGQFLTVIVDPGTGKKERRSYSMCTSPYTDISPAITVKRIAGGLVSNFLYDHVKPGDVLEVMEPMGVFTFNPNSEKKREVVLIAAGSGITPLISIAKAALIVEPETRVVLLYGNRSEGSVLFKDELDALERKYKDRLVVIHSLSQPSADWSGHVGRLTKPKVLKLLDEVEALEFSNAEVYLCGPEEMMEDARRALDVSGFRPEKIHRESFLPAGSSGHDQDPAEIGEAIVKREIVLRYEGSEYRLTVQPHESVLEAALNNDIDLPYSCQAGMCTACIARTVSGEVHLDEREALTDAELADGYILTCCAHPLTDDVVIEAE